MSEFQLPIRVYIEDTDAGGIVYYVNYLKYIERARTEWFRHCGYDKPAIFDHDLMFVVHSVNVEYRKPATLDDELTATAEVVEAGRTYFVMDQKVLRDGELLCKARVKVACVSRGAMRPAAIPPQVREAVLAVTVDVDKT